MRVLLVVLGACGFSVSLPAQPPDDADIDAAGDAGIGDARSDAMIDAGPNLCNDVTCAAAKGVCTSGTCVIDENTPAGVVCPTGMPCKVVCDAVDSCKTGGVDCGGATTCEVSCSGASTCQTGGVDCGQATTCNVRCVGQSACQTGVNPDRSVECRSSTCTVTCNGVAACQDGIDVDTGGTCTSHCCGVDACQGGFDTCTNDNICS